MNKQMLELADRLASMPASEAVRDPQDWAVIMQALRQSSADSATSINQIRAFADEYAGHRENCESEIWHGKGPLHCSCGYYEALARILTAPQASAVSEPKWVKILADNWRGRNGNTTTGDSVRNSCADELEKVAARYYPAPDTLPQAAWQCAARKQGTPGGNAPADCDWPGCGCDPAANKVLEAIDEAGFDIQDGKGGHWCCLVSLTRPERSSESASDASTPDQSRP